MTASEIRLYPIPEGTPHTTCKGCGAPIAFVPGVKSGSIVPVSLASPLAEHQTTVPPVPHEKTARDVIAAPSHFTDCPAANSFGKGKRP